jgi:hypothetical protein
MAAKSRTSADDKSRQTNAFKSITGYGKNIGKEIKETVVAFNKMDEMSNTVGPGTDAYANVLRKKFEKQMGQVAGSLIGKRYNSKGKGIK